MTFKWIAGLANAIDGKIDRMSIVNKSLNDTNVQNAINIIKNACKNGSINSYYNNYLSILDQQYKSADYNNNYKYIWKYRPKAVERFMNGEYETDIFKDWDNSLNQTDKPNQTKQQPSNKPTISNPFKVNYSTIATDTDNFN
jgi:hypothetical protein